MEQVRKGGLPPLFPRSGGKPPFLTCSISACSIHSCGSCPEYLLSNSKGGFSRFQPDLDQHCCWSNEEQRVQRRMHHLIQPQQHLHERDEEHDDALPLLRLH